jgi:hypothetical protein
MLLPAILMLNHERRFLENLTTVNFKRVLLLYRVSPLPSNTVNVQQIPISFCCLLICSWPH